MSRNPPQGYFNERPPETRRLPMSDETRTVTPRTEAGRRLFGRLWAVSSYDEASRIIATVERDITAIEDEAAALPTSTEGLDASWAAAEAALPEGAYIWLEGPYDGPPPVVTGFVAHAYLTEVKNGSIGPAERLGEGRGPSHAAALRALSASLSPSPTEDPA